MNRRIQRLNEQLKREITGILREEVRDPRVGIATVTDVQATTDLDHARVYLSVPGDEDEKAQTMEGVGAAAPYIRSLLAQRLSIRRMPELHFELDRTLEQAMRIERILDEVLPDDDDEEG